MGTRTYAMMDVSAATYAELRGKLEAAGYEHAIHDDGALDMHGIAIERPKLDAIAFAMAVADRVIAFSAFERLAAAIGHCRSCRECGDGPCCSNCDVTQALAAGE